VNAGLGGQGNVIMGDSEGTMVKKTAWGKREEDTESKHKAELLKHG